MGLFASLKVKEDRPTPKEVYNWRIWALAFGASMGGMIYGYDNAFIGGTIALPSFARDFDLIGAANASRKAGISANIVSLYQAGAFFGALGAFPVAERWGRRPAMTLAAAIFCIGAAMMTATTSSLPLLYAGRTIGGVGVGMVSLSVPLYLAEVSPPSIRGQLVGFYDAVLQIGGLLGFWIAYGVDRHVSPNSTQWRIPMAVQLIPGGMFVICSIFLIESPRWLLKVGREDQALRNLERIRHLPASHVYMQEEVAMIKEEIEKESMINGQKATYLQMLRELFKKGIRNRLAVGLLVFFFQNFYGVNAVNYYAPTIFRSIGITGTSTGLFATGIYGVVKLIATWIWVYMLIDQVGRRNTLLYGSVGGAFCMFWVGIYVAVGKPQLRPAGSGPDSGGISAIAAIYIFVIIYCLSYSGTPWVVCSEIFPLQVRALGVSVTSAAQWGYNVLIARSVPYMILNIGYGTYIFFGCMCIISFVWVYFFLPETKGIPLEQMTKIFGGSLDVDAHGSNLTAGAPSPELKEAESRDGKRTVRELV